MGCTRPSSCGANRDRVEAIKMALREKRREERGNRWSRWGYSQKICCRLCGGDDRNLIIAFLFPVATKNWESIRCKKNKKWPHLGFLDLTWRLLYPSRSQLYWLEVKSYAIFPVFLGDWQITFNFPFDLRMDEQIPSDLWVEDHCLWAEPKHDWGAVHSAKKRSSKWEWTRKEGYITLPFLSFCSLLEGTHSSLPPNLTYHHIHLCGRPHCEIWLNTASPPPPKLVPCSHGEWHFWFFFLFTSLSCCAFLPTWRF